MIIRIVKMTFKPDCVNDFLSVFNNSKQRIRNFSGCTHLELLHEIDHPEIIYTYSHWQSQQDLDAYRNSSLFAGTWALTKIHFAKKAEAWSMERIEEVE